MPLACRLPELFRLLCVSCMPSLVLGFLSTKIYTLCRRIESGGITLLEVLSQIVNVVVVIASACQSATAWAWKGPLEAYLSE